jgi:hypothetical protein
MKLRPPHFWFRALPPHSIRAEIVRDSLPSKTPDPEPSDEPLSRQPSVELHCRWMALRARAITVRPAIGQRGSRSTWLVRLVEPKRSGVMATVPVCARPACGV